MDETPTHAFTVKQIVVTAMFGTVLAIATYELASLGVALVKEGIKAVKAEKNL